MYNSQFISTYSYYDPELRNKFHSEEKINLDDINEFEDLSEPIYQADLLRAFGFTVADLEAEIEFNTILMHDLYNQFKLYPIFAECIEKAKNKHLCEDLEAGFVILFSYDYFFLTHKCICEYLTTENIAQASIENLKRALKCDAIK
jgi:hypothetical protein